MIAYWTHYDTVIMRYFKLFRKVKQCKTNVGNRFRQFSSTSDSRDVALSYTTYPDKEHTLDIEKTPLIFAHGLFGAKGNLHSVSKHLSNEGRKVITYDARNHGDSDHVAYLNFSCMAEDLAGLIADLRLSQPICMGHSMGGKTAMVLALNNPKLIKSLIVVDVAPGRSPGVDNLYDYAKAMKNVKIPKGASIVQARKEVQMQLSPSVPNRMILQFLLTNLREFEDGQIRWRMNLDAFLNNRDEIADFPVKEEKTFDKPTLFIFGENSDHYKSPGMSNIRHLFPNSQVIAIPQAGHFVHADKPLAFVKIVDEFCSSVDLKR